MLKKLLTTNRPIGRFDGHVESPSPIDGPWNAPATKQQMYRYRKQRGVNLGSFFTLETWLTPSLFESVKDAKSEYDLCRQLDQSTVRERLERHWNTFIDDGDWQWMKGQGITTVRLPISYYHFLPGHPDYAVRSLMKGTDYESFAPIYQSAFACIEHNISKAAQYEIGVLIDLHAAPGAQNTDGHSGLSNGRANFYKDANMSKTISLLKAIVEMYGKLENVTGVELINEPQDNGKLADWYKDAVKHLRATSSVPLILGDCWNPTKYGELIKKEEKMGTLILDHHYYRCFSPQDCSKSAAHHAADIQPGKNGSAFGNLKEHSSRLNKNIIIGEWSAALNPGSLRGCGNDSRKHQRDWANAQLHAFNDQCAGHFFWTLKKEGSTDVGWCLYSAIEQGVLPSGLGRPTSKADIGQLEAEGKQSFEENYQGHVKYWNEHNGGKQMHHQKYRDGFEQIYKDCIDFYRWCGDEIGFSPHWVNLRAAAHSRDAGNKDGEWEFQHGGNKAITCFLGALWT